ncbi:MAG: AMP-binding protein [Actinobacteria bacterium]|nr:AMP-binding protein [Actinomycetota bacterium]
MAPFGMQLAQFGASTAVIDGDGAQSYFDLDRAATAVAAALIHAGVTSGSVVATVCPAGRWWLAGSFGVWRAGGVLLPLEASHPPADLRHPITDSAVTHVLCTPATNGLAQELSAFTGATVIDVREAVALSLAAELPSVVSDADAMIIYTSGTTGLPKGVVHTHRSLAAQCAAMVESWRWSPTDRIVCVLPLHHVHGLVNVMFTPLSIGATVETPGGFDALATWERLASGEVTVFMAVPTVYSRLVLAWLDADDATKSRLSAGAATLRLMVSGSAALPVSTLEQWRDISGHVLLERYGMTELGMALGNNFDRRVPGHVGWPFPGVEIRILDESGTDVADGESGELLVRGDQVFSRYLNRPDATAESFIDGWFRTGDVAQLTPDGYRLLGRASVDIIKSGGEKVSALDIEEVFRTHPAVADCAVVGLPDDEWGERVAMAWVADDAERPTDAEFRSWGKERLAPAKVPFRYLVVDTLPRNPMGKVTKVAVRELFT